MSTTTEKISISNKLVSALEADPNCVSGNDFIRSLRKKALTAFTELGLPQRKSEEYKYSPVTSLFKDKLENLPRPQPGTFGKKELEKLRIAGIDAHLITIINGKVESSLSDPTSANPPFALKTLEELVKKQDPGFEQHFAQLADIHADAFIALNTSLFEDVLFIRVPDGTTLEKPLMILNISNSSTPALINPRIFIHAGKQSTVQIIEIFLNASENSDITNNSLTEILIESGAKALYYKIQEDCPNLNLINTTQVSQDSQSHFDTHTLTLSGSWIRNNLNIILNGEQCETHLNGLFLLNDHQHVDNHTLVDHCKPHCESNQLYKGILDGKSSGVFNGKIFVRQDAQKTNAYQSSKNMLLSDDAEINTKPQLEIYADDVKCSHGSSTGRIDEEALFYLRARGLSAESARRLLLFAFAGDVVNTIRIDGLKEHVGSLVEKRLNV
jgi:Fe-S cluster assembly protein SufD